MRPHTWTRRATYPGRVSELNTALHLLHPSEEDLEVVEVTIFLEGADENPPRRNRLTEPEPKHRSNPSHTPKPLTLAS